MAGQARLHLRKCLIVVMKPLDFLAQRSWIAACIEGSQYASPIAAFCIMDLEWLFQFQPPCEVILNGEA